MKTLYDIIKLPYHDVPPCPYCGSHLTGRCVRMGRFSKWLIMAALRYGEHLEPLFDDNLRSAAFCRNCSYEWPEDVPVRWMSLREIKFQKYIRETDEYLELFKLLKNLKKIKKYNIFDQ